MAKRPKGFWRKLNIQGIEWTLLRGSEDDYPDLAGKHAYTDCDSLTIVFNVDSPPELLPSLFIHELFHAVLFTSGRANALRTAMGISAEGWDAAEEELAEFLGQSLFDALSRNDLLKLKLPK